MRYRKGWFGESYRHYLASKKIGSKYDSNRYFALNNYPGAVNSSDASKGNFAPSGVKRASALHLKYDEQIARAPELMQKGILGENDVNWLRRNEAAKTKLSDVIQPMNTGSVQASTIPTLAESASFSSLPSMEVPVAEQSAPAPVMQEVSQNVAEIDSANPLEEGIAPVDSEGFEEPASLESLNMGVSPIVSPGVPEVPGYSMHGGQ